MDAERSPARPLLARLTLGIAFLAAALLAVLGVLAQPPSSRGTHAMPGQGEAGEIGEKGQTMAVNPAWQEVDRLVSEQKMQAARDRVEEILAAARESGNEEDLARALIRRTQLTIALHGYETAVRELAAAEWPTDPLHRSVVSLFYGQTLLTYLQAYSWEIQQRERIETGGEVDLKAWTREQIATAAQEACGEVWQRREAWGAESIGTLAEYIEQNNYPARIRGTLRDAVTYLWAGLLADSSFWSPEHSQEIYRLSLDELLSPTGPALSEKELVSPQVHPLRKIAALLGDLEAWHRANNRPEAAFEARRTRIEKLADSFAEEEDGARLRADLAAHLDALGRRFEWWSVGRATLARRVEATAAPDALIEARRLAAEGAEAHPDSIGGQQCRALVAEIEAPSYQLATMASDGAERRSMAVDHRNLPALHFRAWHLDLTEQIRGSRDYNLLPGQREILALLTRTPDATWRVDLPPTPDYRQHRTWVSPPLNRPGLYAIVASAREDFRDAGNSQMAVHFILTDLVLLPSLDGGELAVTVRSGQSGRTRPGVEVSLWRHDWQRGHSVVETRTTGADGRARFRPRDRDGRNSYFLLAADGEDATAFLSYLNFYQPPPESESRSSLLFTDRSVYRPRQELLFKVVAYSGVAEEGRYQVQEGAEVTVSLVDPNGEVVSAETVRTNRYGSASSRFTIPAGRLLGDWQLRSSLGGSTWVKVEEYKRPTFEVTVDDPERAPRLNRPATFQGSVRYYFGLPVTDGTVRWQVTREPVYPPWWGWWGLPVAPPRILEAGDTSLDDNGKFAVTFTPEADEREAGEPGISYRYRLSVDVTDEGGETRSAARVFRLGFVAVEAAIGSDRSFFLGGEEGPAFRVRRTDLDGLPRPGDGAWRLVTLAEPEHTLLPAEQPLPPGPDASGAGEDGSEPYQTPGDRQRPRWEAGPNTESILRLWEDGREIATGTAVHGEDGNAPLTLPALAPGAYRLHYQTNDEFGATFETRTEFLVVRDGAPAPHLPAVLLAEEGTVGVGGTARLLVASGLSEQEMVLTVFRGGRAISEKRLSSAAGARVIEIPVQAADRGGFGVRLEAVRDHQLMAPTTQILVPWEDRRLEVDFATFRDRLRPGQSETWRVKVAAADEKALGAGAAELLAYMYDRSLDIFAPHDPPDPLGLYPRRAGVPALSSSLGAGGAVWRQDLQWAEIPAAPYLSDDRLKFFDGYGIGGPGRGGGRFRSRMAIPMSPAPPDTMMDFAAVAESAPAVEEGLTALGYVGGPAAKQAMIPGGGPPGEAPPAEEPPQVRENFAETAFWEPHLLTGADGTVSFEFTVPESVTEWNVWVHALTRDLRAGRLTRQVATVKELLVRPYVPRFLREGDRAEIKVVVNNAGEEPLSGELRFEILDPETDEDLASAFGLEAGRGGGVASPFTVAPGGGTNLTFPITVPARVGTVAFRVVGRAGAWSDGELRPLPVLPGRYHLAQSRFVTLTDADRRELSFADMAAGDDPSLIHEQLVLTVDAQLFYGVLSALPYLVEYPYECTEQSLNRFLSTGIVTSLYDKYPAVARMAKELSARETPLEAWNEPDPNRKMLLEETPWLRSARGGETPEGAELINVLDPREAAAVRERSLRELEKAQTSLGGFPWWPGGPPSPYMTLYLLFGFSKGLEHGVEIPQGMVVRAWDYMHRHYLDEVADRLVREDAGWELVTFLGYVLSSYPDEAWTGGVFTADERQRMLDFSFRHWKQHSPLLKGYLALTLARSGRPEDARLVFDSVMDSARTDPDLGTFWAPEDRAWLWYNDTIETHAFALRTLTELAPDDARRHGLVQWLFLNKKLNHWKSTRGTAEVIYALVHYLEAEGTLGAREEIRVTAGPVSRTFTFEPDAYTGGKNQVVIPGEAIEPTAMATVVAEKSTPGFAFASATWHFSTERLPPEARGDFFSVTRTCFRRVQKGGEWVLEPLAEGAAVAVGDQLEVHLSLTAKHAAEYVHLRDPRGAGFEPETTASGYHWGTGIGWYEEVRDSGTNFFFEWLPAGEYTFKYRLRAAMAGAFKVGPATLQSMYAPEFNAYSSGARLQVEGGGPVAPR